MKTESKYRLTAKGKAQIREGRQLIERGKSPDEAALSVLSKMPGFKPDENREALEVFAAMLVMDGRH